MCCYFGNIELAGEPSKALRRNDMALDFWLRKEPGPGTVAHELLRGSRECPGSTEVALDGWLDRDQAWWFRVHEDSVLMPGGEVLSILWLADRGFEALVEFGEELPLATEPGAEAVRQLVEGIVKEFGYRAVESATGVTVLLKKEPSDERIVIDDPDRLDAAGIRRLVDEIARQQDVHRDEVIDSMLDWQPSWRPYGW